MFMLKSIALFVMVLIIVLFALSNAHHIPMHFVVGEAMNVRLIYLVLFSYLLGLLSASYFFVMLKIEARKRQGRKARALETAGDGADEMEAFD